MPGLVDQAATSGHFPTVCFTVSAVKKLLPEISGYCLNVLAAASVTNGPERTFVDGAANGGLEPNADINLRPCLQMKR